MPTPTPRPPLVTRRPPLILGGLFLVEDAGGATSITEAGESVVIAYETKPLAVKKPPLVVRGGRIVPPLGPCAVWHAYGVQ